MCNSLRWPVPGAYKGHFPSLIVCAFIIVVLVFAKKTLANENKHETQVLMDLDKAFEAKLLHSLNYNVELTQQVLRVLDEVPSTELSRKYAAIFTSETSKSIWYKTGSAKIISVREYERVGTNFARAVLSKILLDFEAHSNNLSSKPTKKTPCNSLEPKTFLSCCRSCCISCKPSVLADVFKKWLPGRSSSNIGQGSFRNEANSYQSTIRLHERPVRPDDLNCSGAYESLFFNEKQMLQFEMTTLMQYKDKPTQRQALKNYFCTTPKVELSIVGSAYFERLLITLASLGVPVSEKLYRRTISGSAIITEPGLVGLIARIVYFAYNRKLLATCLRPVYCLELGRNCPPQLPAVSTHSSNSLVGECSGCSLCNEFPTFSGNSEGAINYELAPTKYPSKISRFDLRKTSVETTQTVTLNKTDNDFLVPGPVDFGKLRFSYANNIPTNSIAKQLIDNYVISCTNLDDWSCKFRASCGKAPLNELTRMGPSSYVVNGEDQSYGEWPSFVKIEINLAFGMKKICGGTLVTDRHVITAAHCFKGKPNVQNCTATLGDHETFQDDTHQVTLPLKKICVSQKYDSNANLVSDDWTLVELFEPVTFNNYIQPACLPFEPIERHGMSAKCFLVGAGVTKFESNEDGDHVAKYPNIVQKMRMDQVSCHSWGIDDLDRSRECYSKVNRHEGDSCAGDSGGPVLCLDRKKRWTLVASVSFGTEKCNYEGKEAWVGVYTGWRAILQDLKRQCEF